MMKVNRLDNNLICVGSIGKSRGLNGEFFLNSYCDPQDNIINYSTLIIENNPELNIAYIKKFNEKFLSKITSIDTIDAVKSFTNLKVFIKESELPNLNQEEFYWHDLIGMKVLDINNNDELGTVKEISNYGSNDLLEIFPSESSIDSKKRQIPFVKKVFILSIDDETITVDWPKDF
ncbi:ribosome maturation factor RimM [Gammaproteobacteria bacterium]|nr:ribosome maturation factor RimM [Gammaproteobacteria bacterium]